MIASKEILDLITRAVSSLPLVVSFLALFVSILNARIPKIDAEFNICLTSVKRSGELWEIYNCAAGEAHDPEKALLKILNNAEWALIYVNSRHLILKSDPVKHLEEEILEPFVNCLNKNDAGSDYLKELIQQHTTGKKTFSALKCGLKRKGIKL